MGVIGNKEKFLKSKKVWLIGIILIIVIIYFFNGSNNVPKGISQSYYNDSLEVLSELNKAFENETFPSDKASNIIADQVREIEKDPSNFTDKEIYINEQLTKMLLNLSEGNISQMLEARYGVAEILEVSEDYNK